MREIRVNGQRLWESLMELARVGAYTDERTGLVGVNRLALTDDEAVGRRRGRPKPDVQVQLGAHLAIEFDPVLIQGLEPGHPLEIDRVRQRRQQRVVHLRKQVG